MNWILPVHEDLNNYWSKFCYATKWFLIISVKEISITDSGKDWYAIQWNLRQSWEKNKSDSPEKNGQITTKYLGHNLSKFLMKFTYNAVSNILNLTVTEIGKLI